MVRASLSPSRRLAAALVLAHAAAVAVLFPLDLPAWARAALALLVAASLVRCLRHHAFLKAKRSVVTMELHDGQMAALESRDRVWREARILRTSCVTPTLTVLNLRVSGELLARHVLLLRDNIDADAFRRIRVLVRWSRPAADETHAAPVASE